MDQLFSFIPMTFGLSCFCITNKKKKKNSQKKNQKRQTKNGVFSFLFLSFNFSKSSSSLLPSKNRQKRKLLLLYCSPLALITQFFFPPLRLFFPLLYHSLQPQKKKITNPPKRKEDRNQKERTLIRGPVKMHSPQERGRAKKEFPHK